MQNLQTIEGFRVRRFLVPVLAMTLGGSMLAGGCSKDEGADNWTPARPTPTVTTAIARPVVATTVTGRVETLAGEPVVARDSPFGSAVGEYRDGTEVEIICQAPGPDAPGNSANFGKPPMADTTWYRLANPVSDKPFMPERWIPQNPVFTKDPVPSCPPQ